MMWTTVVLLFVLSLSQGGDALSYEAFNVTRTQETITASLVARAGGGAAISPLILTITQTTESTLRIKITDPNNERYEVPYPEPEGPAQRKWRAYRYAVHLIESPFAIIVTRISDNTTVFDSQQHGLLYEDQHLSLGTQLPSDVLYGLGEDAAPLKRDMNNKRHTLWNEGCGYVLGQGLNMYGSHPFYLNLEKSGKANGVLLMNSNAMDIFLSKDPYPSVTWHTVGGILDFSIFLGESPLEVSQLYAERIGRPFLPPIWSLGFQISRWGYNNTGYMRSVLDSMVDQDVPVDVQWNDIDYMHEKEDFTVDKTNFAGLSDHVDYLHSMGKRYVMILDPAIFYEPDSSYEVLASGMAADVFIRNVSGGLLVGNVWPGDTVFPDFLHEKTADWWTYWLSHLYKTLDFDGVWIDMNEPESFYDGSSVGCPWESPLEKPPYYPGVRNSLQFHTICLTSRQHHHLHYDTHNLYGWSEAQVTHRALKALRPGNRTFILTRSNFVGSGRWAAHWTGDVHSTWADLAASVPALINMNLFGIPMVGADICGFDGDSNTELCIRWSQLGAFYPFSRNHNTLFARPQEPTAWGTEVTAILRDVILQRYRLILYMYERFVRNHETGEPVVQGLFMQYPDDPFTYDKDRQFLIGDSVMVCPTLEQGAETTWIYFPDDFWHDLWTLEKVSTGKQVVAHYPSPLNKINVFARGGTIIPVVMEEEGRVPTAESVLDSTNITLIGFLDIKREASGVLYVDDGVSDDPGRPYHRAAFNAVYGRIDILPEKGSSPQYYRHITSIKMGSVWGTVSTVSVDGVKVDFTYSDEQGILHLWGFDIPTGPDNHRVEWCC